MFQLKNNKKVGFLLFIIGTVLFLLLFLTSKDNHELFYISGLGASISAQPSEVEVIEYNLNISTLSKKKFNIQSVEPILNEKLNNILISNSIITSVDKTLSLNNELFIEGEMSVNTSALDEDEINRLLLELNTFKVKFNRNEEIILRNG